MRIGVVPLLLLISAGSVFAATAPATAPPSAAKLAMARHAFDLNGGAQGVSRFIDLGLQSSMRNIRVPEDPEARAIVLKFANDARNQVQTLAPQAVNVAVRVYATQYTDQELKDMIAWAESPSGRSIREKAPSLARETSAQIIPMINQALPSILRRTAQNLCADGKCTAKQKGVQAALIKAGTSSPH